MYLYLLILSGISVSIISVSPKALSCQEVVLKITAENPLVYSSLNTPEDFLIPDSSLNFEYQQENLIRYSPVLLLI
jgi:hypothetical protein